MFAKVLRLGRISQCKSARRARFDLCILFFHTICCFFCFRSQIRKYRTSYQGMWNNLLVFSGICLFSLNFLSSSKSMEFPSTKFTVQQTWENQHSRARTSAPRKFTRSATRSHAAASELPQKQMKNNENIIHSGKEAENLHNNFLIPRGIRWMSKNYFSREFINDRKLAGNTTNNADRLVDEKNSQLCFSNHSTRSANSYELRSMSSNVTYNARIDTSNKSSQAYLNDSTLVVRKVKNFPLQLSLNGCADNTCKVNPPENSDDRRLLNVSNWRRKLFDGNRKSDAKNFISDDNQINENLMPTKRDVFKAHRRFDTTKKISARFNISVTDYPINVNFRSYAQSLNENADRSIDHARLLTLTTSKPPTANPTASFIVYTGKHYLMY